MSDPPEDAEARRETTRQTRLGGDATSERESDDGKAERDSGDATTESGAGETTTGHEDGETADSGDDVEPSLPASREGRVELALELLAHLECAELSVSEAVDRIETVTTEPTLTREILDEAEKRGLVERENGRLHTRRGGTFVRFESQVVRREGDFECRRCGAGLSTGHFIRFDAGELGPFGSSCVRKVTGRKAE